MISAIKTNESLDWSFMSKFLKLSKDYFEKIKKPTSFFWIDIWDFHFFLEPTKKPPSFNIFGNSLLPPSPSLLNSAPAILLLCLAHPLLNYKLIDYWTTTKAWIVRVRHVPQVKFKLANGEEFQTFWSDEQSKIIYFQHKR